MVYRFGFLITALMMLPMTADAAGSRLIGKYGDWEAYTRASGGETICYVLAKPFAKAPKSVRHGDIYFMVANWKSGAASEQPSLMADFELKANRPPTARVGNAKIPMFVSRNEAFISSGNDEKKLVNSMRAGSTMRVDAVSERGTTVYYDFSLKGVTAALQKAKTSCS